MAEADDIPADERLWADGNAFAAYHAYPGGFRNNGKVSFIECC